MKDSTTDRECRRTSLALLPHSAHTLLSEPTRPLQTFSGIIVSIPTFNIVTSYFQDNAISTAFMNIPYALDQNIICVSIPKTFVTLKSVIFSSFNLLKIYNPNIVYTSLNSEHLRKIISCNLFLYQICMQYILMQIKYRSLF